ncbi:hypothetical protein SK128_008055 [Halocaridina rubra]|uniref:Peptidase S1 domain-containing protein n=1 Tax=Halocaridina rubra TaxID=373956 RepID=A0AAN8WPV9_HALRR
MDTQSLFSATKYFILFFIFKASLANPYIKSLESNTRIVGGSEVEPGSLPYMVAILFNNTENGGAVYFHCGGAIISNHHVLTAGHCIQGWSAYHFLVVAGAHDLFFPAATQVTHEVVEVSVQDLFYWEDGTAIPVNDVALLRVAEPFVFGDGIGPISVTQQDQEPAPLTPCTVAGWGSIVPGGPLSNVLRSVEVAVVEQQYCIESYQSRIKDTMLCAGYPTGQQDACQGDSGGPLVCNGVIEGVVSWGVGCAEPLNYGVYARVSYFSDWIEKHNYVPQ